MFVREVIRRSLETLTHADLAALYGPGSEVQVLVDPTGLEPIEGTKSFKHPDHCYVVHNFRIPKDAATEPEFRDWHLEYPLLDHYLAIGMTGWNFENERSEWVGFDFDDITAHEGTGVSQDELGRVTMAALMCPWIEVRKSTGGKGLHLRVYVDVPTANHTEHAALGRYVLGLMSREFGFALNQSVDVCGGNMWIAHRKMTAENEGLKLIEPHKELLSVNEEWRDHIDVIERKRTRVRVRGVDESQESDLDGFAHDENAVLDADHRKLLDWLVDNKWPADWDNDRAMLKTHTVGLAAAHEALNLKGIFQTTSPGTDGGESNCFCFPRSRGGWRVVRYGGDVSEAPTWSRSANNWTVCYLNQRPTFEDACRYCNGVESSAGVWTFDVADDAARVVSVMGAALPEISDRLITLKKESGGIQAEAARTGEEAVKGWSRAGKKLRVFCRPAQERSSETTTAFDPFVRSIRTDDGKDYGWQVRCEDGRWTDVAASDARKHFIELGYRGNYADCAMASAQQNAYTLVSIPFQDDTLPGRRVNRRAAKLILPSEPGKERRHPWYDRIMAQCGRGLDNVVLADAWCRTNGIVSGADYLMQWSARLVQHPEFALPWLFFYSSEQNAGKSSFFKALALLFVRGFEVANTAVTEQFNSQLEGAILCAIDELNLAAAKGAYARMKIYTTERRIAIRAMHHDAYTSTNWTHWVHTANHMDYCPIEKGDERIVAIQCSPIPEADRKPWLAELEPELVKEAPDFLRTLLELELPPCNDRCGLPVLTTELKQRMMNLEVKPASDSLADVLQQWAADGRIDKVNPDELRKSLTDAGVDGVPRTAAALSKYLGGKSWDGLILQRGRGDERWVSLVPGGLAG